ncbi:TetR/AcrR family transcriptional regulator [Lentzea sp. NPDC058450]|uniref:TetR/AcrR family transcriptional regulator n=1 Tax=Lentzea sp. NPDC058450 TaxID=3346505 RepID=UPI00365FFB74
MTELGRRERKKLQTRQSIAEAALELFLARGFEDVGVKEIADTADVSVTTLFKHFPSKEALLFDEDEQMESALVAVVREREGRSIPMALRDHFVQAARGHADHPRFEVFQRLVLQTPALREYGHRMWTRHQGALARAIAEETGAPADDVRCAALARFALDARDVIFGRPDREQAADEVFGLLEHGWAADQQA